MMLDTRLCAVALGVCRVTKYLRCQSGVKPEGWA